MPRGRPVRRLARAAAAVARPRRRVRLDNDERRAQLLSLARKAFSDRSYDDVSIDDLAREAKISKGLLYHYFPTKRDLYVAGLREIADELVERVTQVTSSNTTRAPIDQVRAGLDAYLEHIEQHSRAFVSLMRGGIGSDPEVAGVIEGVRQRMIEKFLEQTPFAAVVSRDVRFQIAVRGWIGFVEAATIDWCASPRMERTALRELLVQIMFAISTAVAPQIAQAAQAK